MISTDVYDIVITCKGCESECVAGFQSEYEDYIEYPVCPIDNKADEPHRHVVHSPAQIIEYMIALKQCPKLRNV